MNSNNISEHMITSNVSSTSSTSFIDPQPDVLSFPLPSLSPASPASNLLISPIPPFRTPSPLVNTTFHTPINNASILSYTNSSAMIVHPQLPPIWFPKSCCDSPSPSPPAPPPSPSPSPSSSSNNSNSVFHDALDLYNLSPGISSFIQTAPSSINDIDQDSLARQVTFPPSVSQLQRQSDDSNRVEITLSSLSIGASLEHISLDSHRTALGASSTNSRIIMQGVSMPSTAVAIPLLTADDMNARSKRKRDSDGMVDDRSSSSRVDTDSESPERKKLKDKVTDSSSSSPQWPDTTQHLSTSPSRLPPKPVRNFRRKSVSTSKGEKFEFRPSNSSSAAATSRVTPLSTRGNRGRRAFNHTDAFDRAAKVKNEYESIPLRLSSVQLRQSLRLATVKSLATSAADAATTSFQTPQPTRSQSINTFNNAIPQPASNDTVACGPAIQPSISFQSVGAAAAAANLATSTEMISFSAPASAFSSSSSHSHTRLVYRLEAGSGSSHFEYGGLPILWRKASKKKPQHALVPTYIYLNRSIPSPTAPLQFNDSMSGLSVKGIWPPSISIVVDSHEVVVPKSKEINVKNPHLGNYVLSDSEQHELFECVQRTNDKRKPDVVLHGVKLHRMELHVGTQIIPFFYCSQKRITIEKAFATVTLPINPAIAVAAATASLPNDCACDGKCVIQAVEDLQQQLLKFISLPAAHGLANSSSNPHSIRSSESYMAIGAQIDQMKRIFGQHRKSLLRLPSTSVASSFSRSSTKVKKHYHTKRNGRNSKTTSGRKSKRRDPDDKYCQSSEEEEEEEEEKQDDEEEEEEGQDDESKEQEQDIILESDDDVGDE